MKTNPTDLATAAQEFFTASDRCAVGRQYLLVDERSDGVHLSYDRMASFLAPYGNSDALSVARNLDKKVEALLVEAAA
ncbi:MAG TPA: hypothetical protein VHZ07_06960 [Bryobacteraceae bacterium]|jgi:hypothetical protein|nr:hypothetical protein [Bryobacteraceae bacterium]